MKWPPKTGQGVKVIFKGKKQGSQNSEFGRETAKMEGRKRGVRR